jgi:hypothetical protein
MKNISLVTYVVIAPVIILALINISSCGGPSRAKALQRQLKPGMSAAEVALLLRSKKDGRYFVKVSGRNQVRPFVEFETVLSETSKQKDTRIVVNVLFMGPGFLHNEFDIILDSEGKVKSVTSLEQWD